MYKKNRSLERLEKISALVDYLTMIGLCLLTSLPIVTFGASFSALYKTYYNYSTNQNKAIFRNYFNALKSSWKQSTVIWFLFLIEVISFILNYQQLLQHSTLLSNGLQVFLGLVLLLAIPVVFLSLAYNARFSDNLATVVKNSLVMLAMNLSKAFGLLIIVLALGTLTWLFQFAAIVFIVIGLRLIVSTCETIFSAVKATIS